MLSGIFHFKKKQTNKHANKKTLYTLKSVFAAQTYSNVTLICKIFVLVLLLRRAKAMDTNFSLCTSAVGSTVSGSQLKLEPASFLSLTRPTKKKI